jgi:hypothetical protein
MTFDFTNNNTTLVLPVTGLTGTVVWGDGSSNSYVTTTNPSRTYTSLGTYIVNINNVTNLSTFGSTSSASSVYRNSLTNFSYLVNIPSLTNLSNLFFDCTRNFTINFSPNVTSNVTSMFGMFQSATLFNQTITLDCSSCESLQNFLAGASSFNSPINLINTSKVKTMRSMFNSVSSFNKPITLDCSSCESLFSFLAGASSLNSSLNLTNTSKVTAMTNMFYLASSFNQLITLDCSSCTTLGSFLFGASSFNSPLNLTNTSKVQNMSFMFASASSFNQPITLDCSSCTTLNSFLNGATSFNNTLNLTPIPSLLDASGMLVNTNLSTTNYSNLLTLWGSQSVLKPNVTLTATGIKYNSSAKSYRTTLVSSPNNWNIIDGGEEIIIPPAVNFGLYQKRFLSTSKVTAAAINIGSTKGRGSTTRMLNYCNKKSPQTGCIYQFITMK